MDTANGTRTVVRTSRGLSVVGTRITLYDIMDYLHADWPPQLIGDWLNLTAQQMADVMAYVHAHREDVEKEYQEVVREAEENRRYWDARTRDLRARLAAAPSSPEKAALWAKLKAWRERLEEP